MGSPAEQVEIVEWFCRRRGQNTVIPPTRALGRWSDLMSRARYTTGASLSDAKELLSGDPVRDLAIYERIVDSLEFSYLVWAIRVVENRAEQVTIDPTFVTRELIQSDFPTDDPRGGPLMPSGIHTITLAARLLQAGGGTIRINGVHSAGRDIEWEPASGGLLWIERKDRAFRAAYDDSPDRFLRWAEKQALAAARGMPKHEKAARMVVVGGFHRSFEEAFRLRDRFCSRERNRGWPGVRLALVPDVIALEVSTVHVKRATCTPATCTGLAETKASLGRVQYGRVKAALSAAFDSKAPPSLADLGPPLAVTYASSPSKIGGGGQEP